MSIDNTILQNITIVLLIIFVAFIVTLLLALIVMRRLINNNTHLMKEMREEKQHNKEGLAQLADIKDKLSKEQLMRDMAEHELSLAQERLKTAEGQGGQAQEQGTDAQNDDDTAQAINDEESMVPLTERMTDEQLMGWIDRRIDEMGLHTNSEITLKDTAMALGVTQRGILQALKTRSDDNTFARYLIKKRLDTACRLLVEQPNWKIEAVAIEAGFGAVTTFRTIFRKQFGVSPSQYREVMITSDKKHQHQK